MTNTTEHTTTHLTNVTAQNLSDGGKVTSVSIFTTGNTTVPPDFNGTLTKLSDDPDTSSMNDLWGTLMVLLSVMTISGNTSLIYVIVRTKLLRTTTNAFVISLAVSDLLQGVLVMPLVASVAYRGSWPFATPVCDFLGCVHSVCNSATVLSLMAVSIDRAIAVSLPLKYNVYMSGSTATSVLFYIWFQSLVLSILPAVGWGQYVYVADRHACLLQASSLTADRVHLASPAYLLYEIVCMLVPGLIIAVAFVTILHATREQRRVFTVMPISVTFTMAVHTTPLVTYRRTMFQTMGTLFIIVGILCVLWLPYSVVELLQWMRGYVIETHVVTLTFWMSLASSMANPIVFLSNKKFKQRFKELLWPPKCNRDQRTDGSVAVRTNNSTATTTSYVSLRSDSSSGSLSTGGPPKPVPVINVKAMTLQVPTMMIMPPKGMPGYVTPPPGVLNKQSPTNPHLF